MKTYYWSPKIGQMTNCLIMIVELKCVGVQNELRVLKFFVHSKGIFAPVTERSAGGNDTPFTVSENRHFNQSPEDACYFKIQRDQGMVP